MLQSKIVDQLFCWPCRKGDLLPKGNRKYKRRWYYSQWNVCKDIQVITKQCGSNRKCSDKHTMDSDQLQKWLKKWIADGKHIQQCICHLRAVRMLILGQRCCSLVWVHYWPGRGSVIVFTFWLSSACISVGIFQPQMLYLFLLPCILLNISKNWEEKEGEPTSNFGVTAGARSPSFYPFSSLLLLYLSLQFFVA